MVILTVSVATWQLEEDCRVLTVGDELSSWLTFNEQERRPMPAPQLQVVRGTVRPLRRWPGAEPGRQPVRMDVGGAAFYWDAPEAVTGVVEVAGSISLNNIDAPDGFPETRGVVRRLQMEWREPVHDGVRKWSHAEGEARYEQVHASYLPAVPADADGAGDPTGARRSRWTGVLIDLEVAGPGQA